MLAMAYRNSNSEVLLPTGWRNISPGNQEDGEQQYLISLKTVEHYEPWIEARNMERRKKKGFTFANTWPTK